jgi:molybdenum cofactor cytidylyltransferase
MRHVPHTEHVAGVLLAAGQGTRFGGDKLVARLDGEPLVRHAAAMLVRAGVRELVVVVGPDSKSIEAALSEVLECGPRSPVRARVVVNAHAARGLGTSVAAGVGALGPAVEAALVALGDQPRVPDEVPRALLAAWRGTGAPIVAPRYQGGVRGNPVLFDADVFRELARLDGDEGARSVIQRSADRVRLVDFDVAMPVDVDRREDLERLERGATARP